MTNKQAAIRIIRRLRHEGFEALLAGGCVRDMLLGRRPNDFDVATDARPADVMKLFKRTLKVGARFGIVIVLLGDRKVEVATFRLDSGYADGRHPSAVRFTTAKQDAARRDFTINAMFYDPIGRKVTDYFGGRQDLKKGLIRTVGKPAERFGEDYLRMLRAVRFSAQLGFAIEPQTKAAICKGAHNIVRISGERIAMELEGILTNPNRAAGASQLVETGLAEAIFPAFADSSAEFGVGVLGHLRQNVGFPPALAGFFAGCETQFALDKCRPLKLSRKQNKYIRFLLNNRGRLLDERMSLAKLKLLLAEPYFWDLYELQRAIQKAEGASTAVLSKLRRRINALGDIELRPRPLLNGHDLIRLGAEAGPMVGQLAQEMYIAQLEGQLRTAKEAEKWVRKWLRKHREIGKD